MRPSVPPPASVAPTSNALRPSPFPVPPRGPPPGASASSSKTNATPPPPSSAADAPSERTSRELAIAQASLEAYAVPELYAGRYTLQKQVGKGAYGAVYFALERVPGSPPGSAPRRVAIKHIVNAFVSPTDARRIYREIKVQAHFTPAHPNILPLLEVVKPRDANGFTNIYLVSELMETDLHKVVHSRQDLTSDHISYFIYQTLCALKHIHSASILHRDLKPANLLVNSDCSLKMCDFGLARESDTTLSQNFTEYVVTRWYRAPEVLLSGGRYSTTVDVWAVGCILGELLLRRPMFPGENYLHQLQLITETIGSPTEEDLDFVHALPARSFMLKLPHSAGVDFAELFPHVRGPCLDLLRRMLIFAPGKRITVEEALAHPFVARVRAARRALNEDVIPPPAVFRLRVRGGSSELKNMSVDAIKARFYAELCGLAMTPTPTPDRMPVDGALFGPPALGAYAGSPLGRQSSTSNNAATVSPAPPLPLGARPVGRPFASPPRGPPPSSSSSSSSLTTGANGTSRTTAALPVIVQNSSPQFRAPPGAPPGVGRYSLPGSSSSNSSSSGSSSIMMNKSNTTANTTTNLNSSSATAEAVIATTRAAAASQRYGLSVPARVARRSADDSWPRDERDDSDRSPFADGLSEEDEDDEVIEEEGDEEEAGSRSESGRRTESDSPLSSVSGAASASASALPPTARERAAGFVAAYIGNKGPPPPQSALRTSSVTSSARPLAGPIISGSASNNLVRSISPVTPRGETSSVNVLSTQINDIALGRA